ncbi:MAG: antibiotic biosynthesis monooxygenase [Salaquimonas sp.]|jgi:quinol monooxygenase YgiN|nr:antibiotic biosynthesis monooxygenase [Salaquimonas sp.]
MASSGPSALKDPRKFVIGWFTCKPGMRDAFLVLVERYIAECMAEEGCEFFELNPSIQDPEMVTLAECFSSEEAHRDHLQTEVFRNFWRDLQPFCIGGRFLHIFPDRVEEDQPVFDT